MKNRKVLQVCWAFPHSVKEPFGMYYFYWPTQELLRYGYEVEVFCYKVSPAEAAEEVFDGVRVRRFDFSRPHRVSPQLLRALLATEADLIHTHGYGEFQTEAAFLAARFKKKKLIFTPHINLYSWRRPLRQTYDYTFGRWMLNFSDCVIVFTEYTRQKLLSRGINGKNIRVIAHVARSETLVDDGSFGAKPASWVGRQIILGCGQLSRRKGWFQALKAFELVRRDFPDALFLLLGLRIPSEPSFLEDFYVEVKRLGLGEHVSVLPAPSRFRSQDEHRNRIREMCQAYFSAMVFTHPSPVESFGIVILEAMCARLPVVAHNGTGLPWIVEHGKTGFVVDASDTPAYAGYFSQLLQDSDLRRKMGEAGYQLALTKYSQKAIATQLLQSYQEVLGD